MTVANDRVLVENAEIFTMRELNQRTAQVIDEINASGRPALITRYGRFIAMITPLQGAKVESLALPEIAAGYAVPNNPGEPVMTGADVLAKFHDKR